MIYTGAAACTAQRYVSIVEEIMKDYGGMERIVAIVTYNASSCRNARNLLARKYGKLVACQDQAHIADLLMKDQGEIPWIESTLATLSPIPAILRAFVKLNQRLRELMEDYNRSVTCESTLSLSEFHEVVPSDDSVQIDDPDQYEAYPDGEETERHVRAQERAFLNTAIMMKPVSNVRFASSEQLLEEFVRLRPVLLQVIEDPSFDDLYPARDDVQKTARQKCFIDPIQSETLLTKVKNLLTIFRSCRIYLRVFDGQGAISSDVYETTKLLRERLEALSETDFPEPSSQNKNRLLQVVRNRSEGPLPGMKRVQVRLTSDLHVAAYLMDPYRCPVETTYQEMMEALRRHRVSYLEGADIEGRKRQPLITEMFLRYLDVRNKWQDINLFQRGRETRASDAHKFSENPIGWWLSGAVPSFNEEHKRLVTKLLVEFSVRTLSISPSACAAESSFSLQGRIHRKERARLGKDRVRQLVFINWNGKYFKKMENAAEDDRWSKRTSQAENFEKLVRERDNSRNSRRNLQSVHRARDIQRSSPVRRPTRVSSTVRGLSAPVASVTNATLITTESGRTFVAPEAQPQEGIRSIAGPSSGFSNNQFDNQWPENRGGLGVMQDGQRGRQATQQVSRSQWPRGLQWGRLVRSRGRGRPSQGHFYANQLGQYVVHNRQYRELVPVDRDLMQIEGAIDEEEED